VINIGRLKSGDQDGVRRDIAAVVSVCHQHKARCKVIIETAMLTDAEKVEACTLAKEAEADFVKTSTGVGGGGATVADVQLMRRIVGASVGIKASGGIRDLAAVEQMVAAGATRIGTSAGVKIVREAITAEAAEHAEN
jgi:deoxyribose-phosphate aldolase